MAQKEKENNSPSQRSLQGDSIYRIPLYYYLHVLDQTSNVTRVEVGPKIFIRLENERVILGPQKMVVVPPRHYCIIENPVIREEDGRVKCDPAGQAKLRHADLEVRLEQEPFPLYPGEVLYQDITPLVVVKKNSALHLRAERDFREEDGIGGVAENECLFEGPGTYTPRKVRVAGDNWLVKQVDAYLPGAYEEIADLDAHLFTDKDCQAGLNFADESEAQSFRNVAYFVLYNLNDNKGGRRTQNCIQRTQTEVTRFVSGPPERSQSVPNLLESSSKNKNRNRRGNRRITKADIGLPTDFRHVQRIGWNPTSESEVSLRRTQNCIQRTQKEVTRFVSGPPERSQSVPNLLESSSKNKNRNRRGNRRITKADIGLPTDFRHVQHIGWNPTSEFEIDVDDDLKEFFKAAGVSETQLRDRDSAVYLRLSPKAWRD